ncbi:MAG: VOC family protein [Eggerthellaceae bacterium]|jgi:hypothetical protein|nr:VOC family protein [Eggerthellaceae bacterium]MDR2715385.1 VOC family protein [Coriobacteriaceae bacterium]
MIETNMNKYATNQISYYVEDLESFARMHSALFGSGPFFYMEPSTQVMDYRGTEIELTWQTAFGQFGDLQVELVQVFSEPNPYAEMGHFGFHHFSNWVDDFDGTLELFADAGFEPLFTMQSGGGLRVAYIDLTDTLGHCLEIHAPIQSFWGMVKKAAEDWDGTDPWRKLG